MTFSVTIFNPTRPKPVEYGYVFSMAVVILKHLIINIMAWVPRKINK